MCAAVENPAICEVQFLLTRKYIAVEIHHQLCKVYRKNVMNEGWCETKEQYV